MEKRLKEVSLNKIQKISKKENGKHLTWKQALFVQEFAKTGNASLSARNVYREQNENTARQTGSENLAKPAIRNVFTQLMEDTGITDDYLITRIKQGMEDPQKHFDYTKLALQLKGRLQNTSVNLSHVIHESRKRYNL